MSSAGCLISIFAILLILGFFFKGLITIFVKYPWIVLIIVILWYIVTRRPQSRKEEPSKTVEYEFIDEEGDDHEDHTES